MRVVPFASDMAAGVAECYNDLIAPVPECHPVPPERFASLERLACQHLRDERLMVAQAEGGEVCGFVHVGIVTVGLDYRSPTGPGTIRFLAYRPGERLVGKLLLDWAKGLGARTGVHGGHRLERVLPVPVLLLPRGSPTLRAHRSRAGAVRHGRL